MNFYEIRFALLALCLAGPSGLAAQAQSLTGNVGSAGVTNGDKSMEARIGFNEAGDAAGRIHYDHAFSDWYQFRAIAFFSQPDGGDWDISGVTAENWFQWREEAKDNSGFNGGFRFAYGFSRDAEPDEAEIRLTVTDRFAENWEWRGNIIAEMEAGDGSRGGAELEARAQLSRAIAITALASDDWRLGLEWFGEFGNSRDIPGLEEQAHQVGPVVKVSWDNGVYVQSAVRAGITDGADDVMAKLFVGREF